MLIINKKINLQQTKFNTISIKNFFLIMPYILFAIVFFIIPIIFILIKPFQSNANLIWIIVDEFIWKKIFLSLGIAIVATLFCTIIAYPFAYLLIFSKSIFQMIIIVLITSPFWLSFLVKIIGLKTFFDICIGYSNSTYGHIFTIIGLVYIYIPTMILTIFNVLKEIPKNLIFASHDLGQNSFWTFIKIILPYSKYGFLSGFALVFLSSMTTVIVPQFLNNNNDSGMIGTIISNESDQSLINSVAISRISAISLITCAITLFFYFFIVYFPKLIFTVKKKIKR